jgi:hypothetical protein
MSELQDKRACKSQRMESANPNFSKSKISSAYSTPSRKDSVVESSYSSSSGEPKQASPEAKGNLLKMFDQIARRYCDDTELATLPYPVIVTKSISDWYVRTGISTCASERKSNNHPEC